MVVIPIHVGKNLVEDVLLDGGSGVNIIMEVVKKKFGLSISKPAPIPLGWEKKP
jgi:hypothetical protein